MITIERKQRTPENFADLAILDPASIADGGICQDPRQY